MSQKARGSIERAARHRSGVEQASEDMYIRVRTARTCMCIYVCGLCLDAS